jgi:hypothetical protein
MGSGVGLAVRRRSPRAAALRMRKLGTCPLG